MSLEASIKRKLQLSAVKVEGFIDKLLVPNKPEEVYRAAHHLIKAGGKRLRPYLVLKSCELMGGDPELALPYAAAVEMFHTFTLVHDDIMDNDYLRRGSPTVHTKWGIPLAIVSGDLLFAKAYSAMLEPGNSGKLSKERYRFLQENYGYSLWHFSWSFIHNSFLWKDYREGSGIKILKEMKNKLQKISGQDHVRNRPYVSCSW